MLIVATASGWAATVHAQQTRRPDRRPGHANKSEEPPAKVGRSHSISFATSGILAQKLVDESPNTASVEWRGDKLVIQAKLDKIVTEVEAVPTKELGVSGTVSKAIRERVRDAGQEHQAHTLVVSLSFLEQCRLRSQPLGNGTFKMLDPDVNVQSVLSFSGLRPLTWRVMEVRAPGGVLRHLVKTQGEHERVWADLADGAALQMLRSTASTGIEKGNIKLVSLVRNTDTEKAVLAIIPREHQVAFDPSSSAANLKRLVKELPRDTTLIVVGHVDGNKFALGDRAKSTVGIDELMSIGRQNGVSIFPMGCEAGMVGVGPLQAVNSIDVINQVAKALQAKTVQDFFGGLSGGKTDIVIDRLLVEGPHIRAHCEVFRGDALRHVAEAVLPLSAAATAVSTSSKSSPDRADEPGGNRQPLVRIGTAVTAGAVLLALGTIAAVFKRRRDQGSFEQSNG